MYRGWSGSRGHLRKVLKLSRRFFIQFAYDGTAYHGWQRQENALSVQEVLEVSLSKILNAHILTTGQGRTDTGVHARQCFAHFDWELDLPADLSRRLNRILPEDISVQQLFEVPVEAHARYTTSARSYSYCMHFEKDPFQNRYSTFLHQLPDADKIQAALPFLLREADFGCFARTGGGNTTNRCHVTHVSWEQTGEQRAEFKVTADRFLRNMVRAMVGSLLEVGYGKKEPSWIEELILSGTRSEAGQSVAAAGLTLERVHYPDWVFSRRSHD